MLQFECIEAAETKLVKLGGGSPGLVVMGGDSCSKGHEFEFWHCIKGCTFFTFIFCKNCNVCV